MVSLSGTLKNFRSASRHPRYDCMKKTYEAWNDEEASATVFSPLENLALERSRGLLAKAEFLHRIEADTHEEAQAVHHIKMGWAPYVPMGKPEVCPKGCGAMYYPKGSGECPNCGRIC